MQAEVNGSLSFRGVDTILVPSRAAQDHYERTLGRRTTAIPVPWDWKRVRCPRTIGPSAAPPATRSPMADADDGGGAQWALGGSARAATLPGRARGAGHDPN